MLAETQVEEGFGWELLAGATEKLSGSDLKELCRNAAMAPVREYLKERGGVLGSAEAEGFKLRPLRVEDFGCVDNDRLD